MVLENEVLAHQPLLVNGLEQAFTEVKEFLASFSGRQVVMLLFSWPSTFQSVNRMPAGKWLHPGSAT